MLFKYHDSPLYYRAAREAASIEQGKEYDRAAKVWAKANRASRNPLNQDWSEKRADFCAAQYLRDESQRRFEQARAKRSGVDDGIPA
ncbi:ANR family transcriptional regulator [Candidatus Sodalis endolongispinus]|uniref:ANR family transcriptional regulator n=1 Tax=Candidatus Sodalis endolongispinus TaxID=2812662 RepID=A0ABS5YAM1_9GAMM|nr:ANR family transcriptional regulator [Candidatus Sodalis endolongispinus]MBT9431654.1 ANR family transcriptional regulator [Candidatus Sodalis endolongispinus]